MVMKYSPTNGRRDVADTLARLLEHARATEDLPAELSLKLVRGLARGTRLLERGDLSDMEPEFEDTLSARVAELRVLVSSHRPRVAAALEKPNLLPLTPLQQSLQTFLETSKPDPDQAAQYLHLRDDLELLRHGLGELDLIHPGLQAPLALADERFFAALAPFACASIYAETFMACLGVDPDPDGPFGFWAAVAGEPDDEEAWRAGALLAAAGPETEQITDRLTQEAHSRGAPSRYLMQKMGKLDAEQAAAIRVVATLALAAALGRRRRGPIPAVGAAAGELQALPDPDNAVLLGQVPDLGLELRAQQEPGEVRLILYFPDVEQLQELSSARVPSWEKFPTGAVGRVAVEHAPPPPPPSDQIQINAVYGSEDVQFVINLGQDQD